MYADTSQAEAAVTRYCPKSKTSPWKAAKRRACWTGRGKWGLLVCLIQTLWGQAIWWHPALSISALLWLWEKGREMLPRFIVSGAFWSQAGWVLHEDVAAPKLQVGQQEIKPQEHNKVRNGFTADIKKNPTALNNETQGCDLLPLTSPVALALSKLCISGVLILPP